MSKRRTPSSGETPDRLLPLFVDARQLWGKLSWEARRLQTARESSPFDLEGLVFGAINFAITAQSLEDWAIGQLLRRDRANGVTKVALLQAIGSAVPMQPAFRDIANTAKHGIHRDSHWLAGTVELVHFAAFSGTPREYVLIYHGADSRAHASDTLFDDATAQWRAYLESTDLI
ncbi:hypothetical protein [Sphingomonas sp. MS122]|uniref:hypothetical protein n=1 Tax=Sphingomonas sp. MS122 TaxID=3412683 RepID=UPI003C2B5312